VVRRRTREFFELAESRLVPDGVFLQWMGLNFLDEPLLRSLLATLASVFDHVRVYLPPPGSALLFLASNAPLEVEASAPIAIEAAPDVFGEIGIRVPDDVTSALLLDAAGSAEVARGAPLITDDYNLLQIRSPRLEQRMGRRDAAALAAPFDPLPGLARDRMDPFYLVRHLDRERATRLVAGLEDANDREVAAALVNGAWGGASSDWTRLTEVLRREPRHAAARAAVLTLSAEELAAGLPAERVVEPPLDDAERAVVAGWRRRESEAPEELRALDAALARVPARHPLGRAADFQRAAWRVETGDPALAHEAIALMDRAMRTHPTLEDLILRARACVLAEENGAALDTLRMLSARLGPRLPRRHEMGARALRVALSIEAPPGSESAPLREKLVKIFEARVR
jgi:hypothetical protein